MPLAQPTALPGVYTLAAGANQLPTATQDNARMTAWVSDRPGTAGYMVSNGTGWEAPVQTAQLARVNTAIDGTYTWTYPKPYGAGVVPNIQAIAQASAGSTDVINVQIDGAPTNTQAKFRVTRTQQSVVSLLGLTILSVPASIGAVTLNLKAEA